MKINFILILSLFMFSCGSYSYLPTKQNVMVFAEKGDAILSGTKGLFFKQDNVSIGYAFTENMGVYSTFNKFDISEFGNSSNFIKDFIWDNELVLFKKRKNGVYTAVNLGQGFGNLNLGNPYYKLALNRQFILPTLAYNFSDNTYICLSSRFTRLGYKFTSLIGNGDLYDTTMSQRYFNVQNLISHDHYLIEPALTYGFIFDFIKLEFQYSQIINSKSLKFSFLENNLSTTLSINFNKFIKGKNAKVEKLRWSL